MKFKVCGMRDKANIIQISDLGPDYMGFIFYPKSPRYVGEEFELPPLEETITPVGVFVNASVQHIIDCCTKAGIKAVQLHGDESVEECGQLKGLGYTVLKVFSIDSNFNFDVVKPYNKAVDFFLFDTKGEYYGGNAKRFDWNMLKNYDQEIPFFLSGGLTPENVLEVKKLKGLNIYAVDINSGVEEYPGHKSKQLVQEALKNLE